MTSSTPGRKLPPLSPRTENTTLKKQRRNVDTFESKDPSNRSLSRDRRNSRKRAEPESVVETERRRSQPTSAAASDGDDDADANDVTTRARSESTPHRANLKGGQRSPGRQMRKRSKDGVATNRATKSKSKVTSQSREALVSSPVQKKRAKKKKKKKKRGSVVDDAPIGLAAEVADLHEDVVVVTAAAGGVSERGEDGRWASGPAALRSIEVDRLFMERAGSFKSRPKRQVEEERAARAADEARAAAAAADPDDLAPTHHDLVQVALRSQRVFTSVLLFLHGVFAGGALWHAVTVYVLSHYSFDVLLRFYGQLAWPVQSIYYLFFAACTVSVFDRFDINRPSRRCAVRSLGLHTGGAACLLYTAGLVVSLAIANIDDRIRLQQLDADVWSDGETMSSELRLWRTLNLVRAVFAVLGWAAVCISPAEDRLSSGLQLMEQDTLGGGEGGVGRPPASSQYAV